MLRLDPISVYLSLLKTLDLFFSFLNLNLQIYFGIVFAIKQNSSLIQYYYSNPFYIYTLYYMLYNRFLFSFPLISIMAKLSFVASTLLTQLSTGKTLVIKHWLLLTPKLPSAQTILTSPS